MSFSDSDVNHIRNAGLILINILYLSSQIPIPTTPRTLTMSFVRQSRIPARSTFLLARPYVAIRSFSKPSPPAANAEDELKHRASYEKHRVEVDPRLAGIDENMTFEHPRVSRETSFYLF